MDFFISALPAFAGAALGGILAGIGFLLRQSFEIRKEYKLILFDLLGLYKAIQVGHVITARGYLEFYREVLVERGYEDVFELKWVAQLVETQINSLAQSILPSLDDWDSDNYIKHVNSIASHDPILAHSLNANITIKETASAMRSSLELLQKKFESMGADGNSIEKVFSGMEAIPVNDLLDELSKDIARISRSCGLRDRYRIWWWLRRNKTIDWKQLVRQNAEQLFEKLEVELERSTAEYDQDQQR